MERIDPWTWRPPLTPWFDALRARLAGWPAEGVEPALADGVRRAVDSAAAARADWVYHPFCTTLVSDGPLSRAFGTAQAVGWARAHEPALDGALSIARAQRLWRTDGSCVEVAGRVDAAALAALVEQGAAAASAPGDPLVLHADAASPGEGDRLRGELASLLAALPIVAGWVRGTLRALDLLPEGTFPTAPDGALVSCSSPEVPGFIRISRSDAPLKLLEMVSHETAHLYLFRAEAAAPLIDPGSDAAFASPLRHEPRPLRGILLALHACAYIAAAYKEAERSGVGSLAGADGERERVLGLFEESRDIVASARAHFTDAGRDFIRRTEAVAGFARS